MGETERTCTYCMNPIGWHETYITLDDGPMHAAGGADCVAEQRIRMEERKRAAELVREFEQAHHEGCYHFHPPIPGNALCNCHAEKLAEQIEAMGEA